MDYKEEIIKLLENFDNNKLHLLYIIVKRMMG